MTDDPSRTALQTCGLLSFLICFISILYICTNYWVSYKQLRTIEILSILSIIGFGINGLSSASYFMSDQCNPSVKVFQGVIYCDILNAVWVLSWRSAVVMMQILYMRRLQYTFDHMARYKTPKKIYNLFYALNGIFLVLCIVTAILSEINTFYFAIATIVSQILQFIICFGLIGLYIKKLFLLNERAGMYSYSTVEAVEHTYNPTDDFDEDSDSAPELSADTATYDDVRSNDRNLKKQHSNNPAQQKILAAISKMTVLSALAVISSETMFTFQAIGSATGWLTKSDAMLVIWYLGWDIDVVINAMSLFLSFDFNDAAYQKWCCGLHRCCMWTCNKCGQRKRRHNANDLEESLISL